MSSNIPTTEEMVDASNLNSSDFWPTDRNVTWELFDDEPIITELYHRKSDDTFWLIEYRSGSYSISMGDYNIIQVNAGTFKEIL